MWKKQRTVCTISYFQSMKMISIEMIRIRPSIKRTPHLHNMLQVALRMIVLFLDSLKHDKVLLPSEGYFLPFVVLRLAANAQLSYLQCIDQWLWLLLSVHLMPRRF